MSLPSSFLNPNGNSAPSSRHFRRRFWRPRRHAGGAVILAPCAYRGASRLLSPRPTYRSADRCDQNVLFCPRCREIPHPQGPAPSEWAAKHVVETPSWRPPRVRPHGSRQSKAHGSRGFPIRMVVGHGGVRITAAPAASRLNLAGRPSQHLRGHEIRHLAVVGGTLLREARTFPTPARLLSSYTVDVFVDFFRQICFQSTRSRGASIFAAGGRPRRPRRRRHGAGRGR